MHEYFGARAHLMKAAAPAPGGDGPQVRCDAIQADFRAGSEAAHRSILREPPPLAPALVPTDDVLKLRLADELDYARRMLDSMGDQLATDMQIMARHGVAIQSVDIVGQMLGHIASVIRSSDPDGAVERIGMCELKGRLKRKSGV